MIQLTITVLDRDKNVLCEKSEEEFVDLVYSNEYNEGDCIVIKSSEYPVFLNLQVDEVIGRSLIYLTDDLYYYG